MASEVMMAPSHSPVSKKDLGSEEGSEFLEKTEGGRVSVSDINVSYLSPAHREYLLQHHEHLIWTPCRVCPMQTHTTGRLGRYVDELSIGCILLTNVLTY
jgi:hypothetical protein